MPAGIFKPNRPSQYLGYGHCAMSWAKILVQGRQGDLPELTRSFAYSFVLGFGMWILSPGRGMVTSIAIRWDSPMPMQSRTKMACSRPPSFQDEPLGPDWFL